MKRESCTVCLRAKATCICHLFTEVKNNIHVVVLQHPTEVKQTKGTVTLLANSLIACTVIVGETFDNNNEFKRILSRYNRKSEIALLYPSDEAKILNGDSIQHDNNLTAIKCFILIDGTWKKSYKMYKLNECFHNMNHLTLPDDIVCDYRIRKTKKEQALSSLEACVYALGFLEHDKPKYQKLLNNFTQFNDLQLSFREKK